MKHTLLGLIISAIITLNCSSYTLASSFTINTQPPSFTTYYDGIQGYQWLSFAETINHSRTWVEDTLLTNPIYAEYQYATRLETEAFIEATFGSPINFIIPDKDNLYTLIPDTSPPNWLKFTTSETLLHTNDTKYQFDQVAFLYGAQTETIRNVESTRYGHFSFYEDLNSSDYALYYIEAGGDADYATCPWFPIYEKDGTIASLLVKHPVPEPTSLALFGIGLLGFSLLRPRR